MSSPGELPPPDNSVWAAAVGLLRDARQVCLVPHVNPDADALGSALALGIALCGLGKDVLVSFGDEPPVVAQSLNFLPGLDLVVPPSAVPPAPELLVVLDTASVDRLGVLADRARTAQAVVVVDHHVSNTGFGTHNLIDTAAPATAVLADELLRRLEVPLTADVATALYAGVATDTGSFKYAGTTPATHLLAARLLSTGVRQDVVGRHLWDSVPFGYLKLLAGALAAAEFEPDAAGGLGLVWTVVPRAERQRLGVAYDVGEGVIDVVRKAAGAEVAAVLRGDDRGAHHVSVRSFGQVDVGRVCTELGGAAGFTALDGVPALLGRLRERPAGETDAEPA